MDHTNAPISKVFYINLDQRPERRARIEHMLKPCPWPTERVPGVVLEKEPEAYGYAMQAQRRGMRGVAGIWLAHRNCIEHGAALASKKPFIVLEDDLRVSRDFWREGLDIIEGTPDDWEIILLNPRFKWRDGSFIEPDFTGPKLLRDLAYGCSGAHFCIFRNSTVARRIGEQMKSAVLTDVDVYYIQTLMTYGIPTPWISAGGFASDHHGLDLDAEDGAAQPEAS